MIAEALLACSPVALQLRAKSMTDGELVVLARELRAMARAAAVPFVTNDRADLARLVDADALHLGQDDLPIDVARRVVGQMPIGLSTHSLAQALEAAQAGADYLGFGPVFSTASKADADPTVGVAALGEVLDAVQIPVVAIGGITLNRVAELRRVGANMAAVIGAVGLADDPRAAAGALHHAIRDITDIRNSPATRA